jgi:hypothetical protein
MGDTLMAPPITRNNGTDITPRRSGTTNDGINFFRY